MHPLIIARFALAINLLDVAKNELHFEDFRDDVNLSSLLSSHATKPCTSPVQVHPFLLLLLYEVVQLERKVQLGPIQLLKNNSALSTVPVKRILSLHTMNTIK